jgi:hypothetical protein
MNSDAYKYDVALSYAGEDRKYVERVAAALKAMGIRVFYDKYEDATLWGKKLYTHLQDIYTYQARYTVMFISKHYKDKLWTNHERESAQARAFKDKEEYILPARFDDTQIPGMLSTVAYVNLADYSPEKFAELIKRKLEPARQEGVFYESQKSRGGDAGDKTQTEPAPSETWERPPRRGSRADLERELISLEEIIHAAEVDTNARDVNTRFLSLKRRVSDQIRDTLGMEEAIRFSTITAPSFIEGQQARLISEARLCWSYLSSLVTKLT